MVDVDLNLEDCIERPKYPYIGRSVATNNIVLFTSPDTGFYLQHSKNPHGALFITKDSFSEEEFVRLKGTIKLTVE